MLLSAFFDALPNKIVSIIGCGGKTSLLWALAKHYSAEKVLVTTTTHIHRPDREENLYDYCVDNAAGEAKQGITLALAKDDESGKNRPLPQDVLNSMMPEYDHILIEADGSRSKPLKGWASYEPVVLDATTVTVGILPLWTLGLTASGELIHRLPLFKELTGAGEGQTIQTKHFYSLITGVRYENKTIRNRGLFAAAPAHGKKVLFFNQVEDECSLQAAKEIASFIKNDSFEIDLVIAGSIQNNCAEKL